MNPEKPGTGRRRRGPGRPSLTRSKRRADRLTVRLTPAELAMVERLGHDWAVSPVEVLRRCLRQVIEGKED